MRIPRTLPAEVYARAHEEQCRKTRDLACASEQGRLDAQQEVINLRAIESRAKDKDRIAYILRSGISFVDAKTLADEIASFILGDTKNGAML